MKRLTIITASLLCVGLFGQSARAETAPGAVRLVGEVFKDCPVCPTLIVVPQGTFFMGKNKLEKNITHDFAMGIHEITFAQWDHCVADGACNNYTPDDAGWGRENRPVIHINWQDATAYTTWLSRITGKTYRLPSESEWEYAARAGTETAYWWGQSLGRNRTNTTDSASHYSNQRTTLTGSFHSNPFGLYDTLGNVAEWTTACLQGIQNGTCLRAVRGGAWDRKLAPFGVNARVYANEGMRSRSIGFRVLRELSH